MKTRTKAVFAIAAVLSSSAGFAADTPATLDKTRTAVTPGELIPTGSEVKKMHEGEEAKEYRICVKTEKNAPPMTVIYDGQETVLKPGECTDVAGRKIDATPEHALTGSAHIVATFHHVKGLAPRSRWRRSHGLAPSPPVQEYWLAAELEDASRQRPSRRGGGGFMIDELTHEPRLAYFAG